MIEPYIDERLARARRDDLLRQAQEGRLAASVARPWLPPVDIRVRFELHVSTRRPAPVS